MTTASATTDVEAVAQAFHTGVVSQVEKEDWFAATTPERQQAIRDSYWGPSQEQATRLLTAVETRDVGHLCRVLHMGNPTSRRVFADLTGCKLPRGEQVTRTALREWIGPEKFDAYWAEQQELRKQEHEAREVKAAARQRDAALAKLVRYTTDFTTKAEKVGTVREMIDFRVAAGAVATEGKWGCTKTLKLTDPAGWYVVLRARHEIEYANERIAVRDDSSATGTKAAIASAP